MLREVSAHSHQQNGIERVPVVGEVVLLKEPNVEQKDYKLGVISEVHESKCDNAIRSATVKTGKQKYLTRPINHLYPLEIQAAEPIQPVGKIKSIDQQEIDNTTYKKHTTQTSPNVSSRVLRPRQTTKSTFFVLLSCLTIFATFTNANPCPENVEFGLHNLIDGEYCKPVGILILKIDDYYCWKRTECENSQVLRDKFDATHGFCGPPCKCPHWANDCSFYEGEKADNSTTENPTTSQLLSAADAKDVIHANVIQLYDHSRHPVSELHLWHQQINLNDVKCYGVGAVSGTPTFCSQNHCYSNATKFCSYQLQEIVYWRFNGYSLAIKAWGTTTLKDATEDWKKEPTELSITCENNLLSINAKHKIDIVEITSTTSFHAEKIFNTNANISIPPTTLLTDQALSVTVLFEDDSTETKPILCSTIDFCEQIRCSTLCWDELLNPTCRPWKSIALAAIIIALFWMTLSITVLCCCCCRRRRRRYFFFGPEGPPTVEDVGGILIRYYPKTKFYFMIAMIIVLLTPVQPNAEYSAITAHTRSCTATNNVFLDCKFTETSELFIPSGTEIGILLKDSDDHPFGTVKISAEIQATCVPEKEHYTRIFKAEVSSSKRCRGAGPCSGLTCAHTGPDDKIEGLGVANLLPGVTSCAESCGCWGCSCFICESGCLFYRYFVQPITTEAIRIFSCSTLTPTVVLNITVSSQEKTNSELMVLKNGETSSVMNIEISLLNTFENIHLNELHVAQSETRAALLDTFSISAAELLKCGSKEDALKLKNCRVPENLCYCHAADSVAKCNCNSNQILEQALKENSLPYRLPQGWLRKTQHGVTAIQDGRVQLKIALQDLQLSTVVDRNRCHATAFEVKGCSNCNSGAIINITCKSDFGTALGHVNCQTFSFALRCDKRGTQQQIKVYSTSTQINETCTLRCTGHKSSFIITGLLWNTIEENPWSNKAGNSTESPFTITAVVSEILEYAQQTYTRIALVLVLAVVLILVLNKLILR